MIEVRQFSTPGNKKGLCRPVLMEGTVKEAGFQQVARTYLDGVVASEIITAIKG